MLFLTALLILGGAVGSFVLQNTLARDITHFEYSTPAYTFQAHRDASGVWNINAKDEASLFFAWGYLQTLDREFQLMLFWHIGLGRLSELVGPSQLSRDHMMRLSAHLGQWDYEQLSPNSLTKKAVDSFVAGRNVFLDQPPTAEPIEYRLMGLKRKTLERWQPWQVMALVRFHTSEFSYDFSLESKWVELNELMGPDMTRFLMPLEEATSEAVYDQPSVAPWVQAKIPSTQKIAIPAPYYPTLKTASHPNPSKQPAFLNFLDASPDFFDKGSSDGASNIWLLADPATKRLPTLCNDPHLAFSWPSPLYPVRYKIENLHTEGQGLMLPGFPAVVIGAVSQPAKKQSLTWGITMASYADTQDLIEISDKTIREGVSQDEVFRVHDPKTSQWSEEKLGVTWTAFGPRIDELYNFGPKKPSKPLALDWLGYRKFQTLTEFMLKRDLYAQDNLLADLAGEWTYPSVNFTWIERAASQIHFGHAMTGLNFSRSNRLSKPFVLSESEARARNYSQPSERPFFYKEYKATEKTFLESSNHKIFKGALSGQIASDWNDNNRARQVLAHEADLLRTPEYSQTDFTSRSLQQFLAGHLSLLKDPTACPATPTEARLCQEVIAQLALFDGNAQAERWEPYLAFLWYVKVKENLWPDGLSHKTPEHENFFSWWVRGTNSARLINQLSQGQSLRADWEQLSKHNYSQMIARSFHEAFSLLAAKYSDPRKAKWGDGHMISWQHLFALAPPPVGPFLSAQLLGKEKVSGGLDSPGRFDFGWKPSQPLELPATHGDTARFCVEVTPDEQPLYPRWSIVTGVSGNPFSPWAQAMPRKYFFKNKLYDTHEEK